MPAVKLLFQQHPPVLICEYWQTQVKQEAQLSQRDRATRYVSVESCQLLHSCTKINFKRLAVGE